VRIATAGVVAILAAIAIELDAGARADQTNPFPSPSPVESVAPGFGGYASIGFAPFSARGGVVPASVGNPSPYPFKAAGASGYSLDAFSRISTLYAARLRYQDVGIHGDDNAFASRLDAMVFYTGGARVGIGVGVASVQRSNAGSSSNGFGLGAAIFPDFSKRLSPYLSADLFTSLPAPGGKRGALDVIQLGGVFANRGGTFERIGVSTQIFTPNSTSPFSLWGIDFGVGATF